jgi:hypothetical protein
LEGKKMKCEKCGHFNPYWRTDWRDTEREFARREDVSLEEMPVIEQAELVMGRIAEWNGFVWKMTDRFIRRIPIEIFKARGKWGLPYKAKDYFDATSRPSNLGVKK